MIEAKVSAAAVVLAVVNVVVVVTKRPYRNSEVATRPTNRIVNFVPWYII